MNLLGAIFLARLLSPAEFGIYAIIIFIRTFLVAFGDAGLGASLIRHASDPTENEYRAVFTCQQVVVLLIGTAFWFACPLLTRTYNLSASDVWVFRLVDLSLLCSSFQVIPSVRLEREVAFEKIAVIEICMSLTFNGISVFLAWKGLGDMSFAWGLFARSIVGMVLANFVKPWKIGWSLDWALLRDHLRFGVPYQGIAFISLLKDSIGPVFVTLLLGAAEMGYINWAMMIATYPVLMLAVLQRVYLPTFARMQEHPSQLKELIEKTILVTNLAVAPLAVTVFVLINPVAMLIFGEKWLIAVPLFRIFWFANFLVPTATPIMALLNALGRSRTTFAFAAGWMVGTWIVGVPLILVLGGIGYALANALVMLSAPFLFKTAQNTIRFRVMRVVFPAWVISLGMGTVLWLVNWIHPARSIPILICYITAGLLLFLCPVVKLYASDLGKVWKYLRDRNTSTFAIGTNHAF